MSRFTSKEDIKQIKGFHIKFLFEKLKLKPTEKGKIIISLTNNFLRKNGEENKISRSKLI